MLTAHIIISFLLAALFTIAGIMKLSQPKQKLAKTLPWVREFKPATIKFIGFSELSGAIGLVGPFILGIGHKLTPYAALGLCIIMVLAGIYHSRKNEYKSVAINLVLFVLGLYICFS